VWIGISIPSPVDTPRISPIDYLLTQVMVIGSYFGLVFWPLNLSLDHSVDLWPNIDFLKFIFYLLIHFSVITGAIIVRKRAPIITLSIFIFYLALLPESSVIPLKNLMVEHRVYLPMVGISILMSYWLTRYLNPKWTFISSTLIIVGLSAVTFVRNTDWQSKEQLWQSTLDSNPQSARAHYSIGQIMLADRDSAQAMNQFTHAVALDPTHVPSLSTLGLIAINQQRYVDAKVELDRALELEPNYFPAIQNMALLCEKTNAPNKALIFYEKAARWSNGDPSPELDLGTLYLRLNNPEAAIEHFDIAIKMGLNSARLYNNYGYAEQLLGNPDMATIYYSKAIALDPAYGLAQRNLSNLHK
jgi:protein O-mannosyl-transferase